MSDDDLFYWPDGSWCLRSEYEEGAYSDMSDDFEIIPFGTDRYDEITSQ